MMADSHDLSDEELEERVSRLEALADGCRHCKELRDHRDDLLTILAERSVRSAEKP